MEHECSTSDAHPNARPWVVVALGWSVWWCHCIALADLEIVGCWWTGRLKSSGGLRTRTASASWVWWGWPKPCHDGFSKGLWYQWLRRTGITKVVCPWNRREFPLRMELWISPIHGLRKNVSWDCLLGSFAYLVGILLKQLYDFRYTSSTCWLSLYAEGGILFSCLFT